ncbi:MAG: 3-methyladenine DNA glycosylase [Dermatophilus congolensis]|nr:3-methyladenine DNA glycosylase [Dermatophilus congolensis]
MPAPSAPAVTGRFLTREQWQSAQAEHEARVDRYVQPHLRRRERGEKHAVEDFLFEYYRVRPGQLRRWHPGAGIGLLDPDASLHPSWKFYNGFSTVSVDLRTFLAARGGLVAHIRDLLAATAQRTPTFGCFGLHEWAMVYRAADDRRHPAPLRLGASGTDEVVESMQVRCTHYDAFRFFTPQARPRNALTPTRDTQNDLEQPGCLHAGMDLYRFSAELLPATPSSLVMDCFEHAMRSRYLDMQASPYDLAYLDLAPIRIETPQGRAEYVAAQKTLADSAAELRARLLAACTAMLDEVSGSPAT